MVRMGRPALAFLLCLVGARGVQLRRQEGAQVAPLSNIQLASLKDGAWKPDDLKVVDLAIRGLLKLNLSPEKHKKVQETADKVRKDLEPVTSNKTLSNAERRAKVGAAIKEIGGLSQILTPADQPKNVEAMKAKLLAMKQELAKKTAKLSEEQKELKLDVLKKELVEKKLQLHKLLNKKRDAAKSVASEDDMKEQSAVVAKLVDMAKAMSEAKKDGKAEAKPAGKPAALAAIESTLQKRTVALKEDIAKIDAQEKKTVGDMDAVASKNIPHLNKDDALAKGQVLLDSLKKEEHRKFEKARALKRSELAELQEAIASIDKGDVKALTKILSKMKHETKSLDARSGRFLH